MDYEFDRGIVVKPTEPGVYAANLDAGWVVGGGVNGGYALAVVGNAIRAELTAYGQPDPVSVSAYYLSPTQPGPATVRVRRLRVGGKRSTVAASLVQEHEGQEVERITALAVYGDTDRDAGRGPAADPAAGAADARGLSRCAPGARGGTPGRATAGALRHSHRPGVRRLGSGQA
ncbi:MAG TPA: acyl-CoA thioesterase domain-containing protein [Microlunatus sp.]|nr:acyl-CoA thioesterase domain-containing protein [Microlunatus sp.]